MSSHDRPVHDVLGRMSDEDNDDDIADDLNFAFVPKSERLKRQHQQQSRVHPAAPSTATAPSAVPAPSFGSTTATTAAHVPCPPPPTETVYERERNAKVRALLAEQQRTQQHRGGIFSLDLFDGPLSDDFASADTAPSEAIPATSSIAPSFTTGERQQPYRGRRPNDGTGNFTRGGSHYSNNNNSNNGDGHYNNSSSSGPTSGGAVHGGSLEGRPGNDGQRRYRMPHPNMSEEEQARYIRARRNMAMTRNALREVDPDTLEYTQVTQAADQVPVQRGRGSYGGYSQGNLHGSGAYRGGRGQGYRGRGGEGRGRGGGGRGFSGGGGGGVPFNPY